MVQSMPVVAVTVIAFLTLAAPMEGKYVSKSHGTIPYEDNDCQWLLGSLPVFTTYYLSSMQ
jgi:hypothetical protein